MRRISDWYWRSFTMHVIQRWTVDLVLDIVGGVYRLLRRRKS